MNIFIVVFLQELYESEHTLVDSRHELDTLKEDNLKTLESILRSEYPTYVPYDESDESGLEDDDDGEEPAAQSDEDGTDQVWFCPFHLFV